MYKKLNEFNQEFTHFLFRLDARIDKLQQKIDKRKKSKQSSLLGFRDGAI